MTASKAERSVIIIGAGLAGLAAGCYAQMNGYESRLFEHHAVPGGVAAAWKRSGYLIDGGIHFIMGHRPGQPIYELYRELGATPGQFIDMTTYGRFIDETNGRSLDISTDPAILADRLKTISPADARFISELMAGARAMQRTGLRDMGLDKPPELETALDKVKRAWAFRHAFRYMSGSYNRTVAEYTQQAKDPWLRYFINNIFLPEVPVWFLFMLLGLLADRQVGLLASGCLDFVLAIEKKYRALGGQPTYKTTVREIIVENGRATGIRLMDGSEHRAGAVVSAADGYSTIFKLLGGRYLDAATRQRYQDWKLVRPAVMASYGVAREFKDEPWMNAIRLERPIAIGESKVDAVMVRIFNYSDRFAPAGKTVVQAAFETEWDFWDRLRVSRPEYDAEKQRIAAEVLERLERHYPGISSQVEMTDVATPWTTFRHTLNRGGAYMGWLPTPEQIRTPIRRTLPGLDNFYMAGQWVMPGGGVPPCLFSGRHVAQLLCHRDGKLFVHRTR